MTEDLYDKPESISLFESLLVTLCDVCSQHNCSNCPIQYCCRAYISSDVHILHKHKSQIDKLKGICLYSKLMCNACNSCVNKNSGEFCQTMQQAIACHNKDNSAQKFIDKVLLLDTLEG